MGNKAIKGVLRVRWMGRHPGNSDEPCTTHLRINPLRMGSWIISLPEFIKFSVPVGCSFACWIGSPGTGESPQTVKQRGGKLSTFQESLQHSCRWTQAWARSGEAVASTVSESFVSYSLFPSFKCWFLSVLSSLHFSLCLHILPRSAYLLSCLHLHLDSEVSIFYPDLSPEF